MATFTFNENLGLAWELHTFLGGMAVLAADMVAIWSQFFT
jgi:hypothetical protein